MTTTDNSRAVLTGDQRSAIEDSARVLEQNWEHATADRLRDAFAIESKAMQHAGHQEDWRGDFERQASAVGFDVSREEIGGEYRHPIAADAFRWYYTGRLDEACSGASVDQHEAAPAEHDVNQLLEAAALGLGRAGMLDSMRIVRGMKPGYPKQPKPSAPLEGTGNGAVPALTDQQWEELRLIARTYNERGFPKHAREFFARAPRTGVAGAVTEGLPHWFDMFLTNVCELPDRNSPEGEPDAIVATLDELRNCAVNAIEQCVSYAQPPSADAAADIPVSDLEQMTPNQRRALDKGLAALETMADLWAVEVRLTEMSERISSVPDDAERAKRIAALIHLGFIEGAYRHFLDHKDGADAATAPADERAATFEWWLSSLSPQRRALIGDVRDARMGWEAARAAARQETVAIPLGYVLVPIKPTDKMMIGGGFSFCGRVPNEQVFPEVRKVWERMLDVAPSAQVATRQRLTDAARDVLAERSRQIEQEGWTPEHDDEHANGELAMAGACYATTAVLGNVSAPMGWPWSDAWFKPTTPRRNLIKAAALILAEIERLDRALLEGAKHV